MSFCARCRHRYCNRCVFGSFAVLFIFLLYCKCEVMINFILSYDHGAVH